MEVVIGNKKFLPQTFLTLNKKCSVQLQTVFDQQGLTLNDFKGFLLGACDLLLTPGGRSSGFTVLHKDVRCLYLGERGTLQEIL